MVSESDGESECEDADDEAGDGEETLVHSEDDWDQLEEESILNEGPDCQMAGPNDPHADVVLRFCYDMATEDFEDGRSSSSLLVYFSAIRGLSRPNGNEYLRPARFTPILAGLIYCARLIILETLLPRFSHLYTGIPARPLYGHLKALNAIRVEKMCDGTMSPLGEFLSLLAYGRALHRAEGPVYHFHWSEDGQVLSWDGHSHLTMNSFRGLSREALRQATIQCRRLMYEWEPVDPDLSAIRDRLSTITAGYSFVADPTNRLVDAYLELFMRACTSPVDGLLKAQSQGTSAWDSKAAQAYLDAHDVLLKVLMVLCQLDNGQGARIPELLTIECCNTPSRLRGIGMYGTKMFSLIRHHKARLTTNNEFQVARFFSPPVALLMYRYLVYIRPVAYVILRKCFHYESTNTLLFAPASRSGSWTTRTFTDELKKLSRAVPGIPCVIGVQLYRQLSIAITEKHVRGASLKFNRFDDVSSAAAEDVAFAWQSGHRPVQRYSTYGLDGAFPDQLQPALLRIYAKVSAEWHAFLRTEDQEELNHILTPREDYGAEINIQTNLQKRPNDQTSPPILSANLPRKRQCQGLESGISGEDSSNKSIQSTDGISKVRVDQETVTACHATHHTVSKNSTESLEDQPIITIGPFVHLVQFNLMVCSDCKYGVVADEIESHLRQARHRHNFTVGQRRDICSQARSIHAILRNQDDLRNFRFPAPETKPILFLEAPKHDGIRCNRCRYVTRITSSIQEHCRDEHGWQNDWKRGGNIKQKSQIPRDLPWVVGVFCQRFFVNRKASGWFEVGRGMDI